MMAHGGKDTHRVHYIYIYIVAPISTLVRFVARVFRETPEKRYVARWPYKAKQNRAATHDTLITRPSHTCTTARFFFGSI